MVIAHRAYDGLLRIVLSGMSAVLVLIALTAGYSTGAVFSAPLKTLNALLDSMASSGPVTSSVIFLAAFVLVLESLAARGESSRPLRYSLVIGAVLALTLTFGPYAPVGVRPAFTVSPVLPSLPDDERTVWYWLFMSLRFTGNLILCTMSAHVFLRAVSPGTARAGRPGGGSPLTALRHALPRPGTWRCTTSIARSLTCLTPRSVAAIGGVIAVSWVPWMVLLYPANIAADTVAQLVWARGTAPAWDPSSRSTIPWARMSDHHPWLDTLLYGAFDRLGFALGNEAYGLFILAVLQTMLCAAAVALLLCYLGGRLHVPARLCAIGLTWYCAVPIFGRLSMSIVKDSTFMPFFLLWLTVYMEYVRRIRTNERIAVWIPVALVILTVGCSLTKKTALYVILTALLVLLIALRRRILTLLCVLSAVALFAGVTDAAFATLAIAPGGRQEMLAIPLQQTAANLIENKGRINERDRRDIGAVFICSTPTLTDYYSQQSANGVKDHCFNRSASGGQIARFLLVWARQGIRHPVTYWRSVPWLRDPFTMGAIYDEGFYVHWGWGDRGGEDILPEYPMHAMSRPQRVGRVIYYALARLPVLGLLMTENIYVVWIPVIGIGLCLLRRQGGNVLYAVPLLASIPTLMLDPAYQTRYSWSLAYGFIVFLALGWMVTADQSRLTDKSAGSASPVLGRPMQSAGTTSDDQP